MKSGGTLACLRTYVACVHSHIYASTHAAVSGCVSPHGAVSGDQRSTADVFLTRPPLDLLRQGLWLNPGFTNSARLTSSFPGNPLSQPLWALGLQHISLGFIHMLGIRTLVLMLDQKMPYSLSHLPSPGVACLSSRPCFLDLGSKHNSININ